MAIIEWDSGLSVNVAEIDKEHRKLIDLINKLNDAMKLGKGKNILENIIGELFTYAGSHFATEERYFDQFRFPDANAHKMKHKEFAQKVSEFKNGFDSGQVALTLEVMNFLKDWLRNHIQGTDKKYSSFFNEKGLK